MMTRRLVRILRLRPKWAFWCGSLLTMLSILVILLWADSQEALTLLFAVPLACTGAFITARADRWMQERVDMQRRVAEIERELGF